MAIFEGTIQEFHHLIGPRIRNAINNFTRSHRKKLNGICEACGLEKELQSAHVHGSDRRSIIETVLSNFDNDGSIKCDIDLVEQKILEAHLPIEKCFKFLCHPCHVEYDSKFKNVTTPESKSISTRHEKLEKANITETTPSQKHQGNHRMDIKEILMVKFYVVNGLSYPAAETAVGHFGGHGSKAMKACRDAGITNSKFKGSMNFENFISLLNSSNATKEVGETNGMNIDPLSYYLENNGFGVVADETELYMAEQYFVNGTPYVRCEEKVNLFGKKGFEAMYAVCKLGGFYGTKNKGSMNLAQFQERKKILKL